MLRVKILYQTISGLRLGPEILHTCLINSSMLPKRLRDNLFNLLPLSSLLRAVSTDAKGTRKPMRYWDQT